MFKMEEEMLDVLREVRERLNNKNIEWTICGSVNLNLQGIDINPSDIDISVSFDDLDKIKETFSDFDIIEEGETWNKEGRYFKIKINNIEIEFCGDYDFGKYYKERLNGNTTKVELDNIKFPVFTLETEKKCYDFANRQEKVHLIKSFIENKK